MKKLAEQVLNSRSEIDALPELGLNAGINSTKFSSRILTEAAKLICAKNAPLDWVESFKTIVTRNNRIDASVEMFAMVGLISGTQNRSPGDKFVKDIATLIEKNFDDPLPWNMRGHLSQANWEEKQKKKRVHQQSKTVAGISFY